MTQLREQHPLAGKTVRLTVKGDDPSKLNGELFRLEYWWQNVGGKSWMDSDGNPACLNYALRAGLSGLPTDDEVVYGKVGCMGYLVHVSELSHEVTTVPAAA